MGETTDVWEPIVRELVTLWSDLGLSEPDMDLAIERAKQALGNGSYQKDKK